MSPKIILTASAALLGAGAALAQTAFLPGAYETTTMWADGTKDTSRHCARAGVDHTLEKRLAAMAQDPTCKVTQHAIGGGKFAIAAACDHEGVKSSYKQSGSYGSTGMTMVMSMTIQARPDQAPATSSFTAVSRRVAAVCPAGMTEE